MNSIFALIIGLVVLAAGGFYVSQRNTSSDTMKKTVMTEGVDTKTDMMKNEVGVEQDAMMKNEEPAMQESGAMMKGEEKMMKAGVYETYSPEKLTEGSARGKVVLFFHASWCPVCRAIDADIMSNLGQIPSSLTILKVDFDTAYDLRKKYGVTTQYTFVQVDADGSKLQQWSGQSTLAQLAAKVQ